MSRRVGEITWQMIDRNWPYQVEVPAEIVAGPNYPVVYAFAHSLVSMAPRNGRGQRREDRDWLRFAFSDPADAEKFRERFGGIKLTVSKVSGRWRDTYEK